MLINKSKKKDMKILKKGWMLALAIVFSVGMQAQKASVETASISLRTYKKTEEKKEIRVHNLKEAKKHIDMAFKNSTTANDPKMWQLRARVYLAIHMDILGEDGKSCIIENEAISIAGEAIINCHKADAKEKYSRASVAYDAFVGIAVSAQGIANNAEIDSNFARAIQYYQIPRDMIPYDDESLIKRQNITSEGLLNSIAFVEFKFEKYEDAKKHYNELIEMGYNDPLIYVDLYTIYLQQDKDTNMAIQTIDKGRMTFDENKMLKDEQIFIYSVANRSEELFVILTDNIEMDAYNSENYEFRGKLHRSEARKFEEQIQEIANSGSKDNTDELEAKVLEHTNKAIEDYNKAIEMDDQNMDVHYELGEMYYIKGADLLDQANALGFNETTKFDKLNAEAKEYFMKAIPSWETLYNYSADEKVKGKAAAFLKQLYLKTEQMDKYKALKAELAQ